MDRLATGVEIEVISRPRAEYQGREYMATNLPGAPAVMLDDEVLVEGGDIDEERLLTLIRTRVRSRGGEL